MQSRSGYAEGVTKHQLNARQTSPARFRTPEPEVEWARSSAPYPAQILPHCSTEFGLSAPTVAKALRLRAQPRSFFCPREPFRTVALLTAKESNIFLAGDPSPDHIQEKNDEGL